MTKYPLVSILILNFNGKKHLINCLRTIKKVKYPAVEVILFDNGSSDGSVEEVKRKFSKIKIFASKKDLGFCKGNNQAYKLANGKYILLLNNDTLVTPDFLDPLVEVMESDSSVGVVQPKIILEITKKLQSGGVFFNNTGFLYHFGYGKNPTDTKYNKKLRIYSANGSCMLIRRKVIEEIGLFDEDYFSYFEETDFCHRAQLAGYQVWYQPKGVIFHIGGLDNKQHKRYEIQFNSFKNRLNSYLKNLEVNRLFVLLPIHLMFMLFAMIAYVLLRRFDNSVAVAMAILVNILNLQKTFKKRRAVQQLRKLRDFQFLSEVTRNPRIDYYFKLFTSLENYKD